MEENNLSFENAMAQLEDIVTKLENGSIPLEEMVALYERGATLAKRCGALLDDYEARLSTIKLKSTPDEAEGEA